MARSTTPPSAESIADPIEARHTVAVAYSGGRDSTALLHATARMAQALGGLDVLALHVHHGLSPLADAWLTHAQTQCQQWAAQGLPVSLHWRHLHLQPAKGDSIEALARQARYQALIDMAQQAACDTVLLAHHRQDQAETFLLQALRGAGVAGLAAMPQQAERSGVSWLRPWLQQPRSAIEHYIAHHGLGHIEDDSNSDTRWARNRLRLKVWPALSGAFEQAEQSLAQAAAHQADVLACLGDWLALQLPLVTRALSKPARLALVLAAWQARPAGQQRELLRAWFRQVTGQVLPASMVQRVQQEAQEGASARWPIKLQSGDQPVLQGELALYRGLLTWRPQVVAPGNVTDPAGFDGLPTVPSLPPEFQALGVLHVALVNHGGVALGRLRHCEWRERCGSEQFQMAPGRPARSLKKQFQALGVPAWERGAPLLWSPQGDLIFVPGLGVDARVLAAPGEPQVSLTWVSAQG